MSRLMSKIKHPKILVILGPTASGKTALAVKLAKELKGEIISADSRQVYRGMDIGTGKDLKEYGKVKYHLINVANPEEEFNLAKYQKLANQAIKEILSRGNLPIIVGGTGLYLQAIIDGYQLSEHTPDIKRRQELEAMTVPELFKLLEKNKPEFANKLNNSDRNNPRRLVRYIEIMERGETEVRPKKVVPYYFLILGLQQDDEEMRTRIIKRIKDRLDNEDMVGEVEDLMNNGLSLARLNSFGLEYRYISWYLQDKMEYDEMVEKLGLASYRFAKRQKTWFKRWEKQGRVINWVTGLKEAKKLIKNWQ
jgi:tRNA dimethylallyltransferase